MDDAAWLNAGGNEQRGRQWFVTALLVALLAVVLRQPVLVLLAAATALAIGIALLWRRYGLRQVSYARSFSQSRAFLGEEIVLDITVENAKPLPLPWLDVRDEFPDALDYRDVSLEPAAKPKVVIFHTLFSTGPYERVRRRLHVRCQARGYHRFGPAHLKTGDIFGFATCDTVVDTQDSLLVYPNVLPVTAFGLPAKQPFGDLRPMRPLIEDPLRFSGVRPYLPGDLSRRVHWRASARTGELQSKQFEPSAVPTLAIFLDVNTFEHFWEGIDSERLELVICAAASLAAHGIAERQQVGLVANAPLAGGERFIRLAPSRHPSQLTRILEALAMLVPFTGHRIEALVASEAQRLPWGATLVVITGYVTADLEQTLLNLHRTGHAVTLLAFGRPSSLSNKPGFAAYNLAEEALHEELAAFQMA